jgi:hypothetical protein
MVKSEIQKRLVQERQDWEALLSQISPERMVQPGAAGYWSVKDIICHITAYEAWLVDWLQSALNNEFPGPSVLDDADTETRNLRVYELTHDLALATALSESRRIFDQLLELVDRFPEQDFLHPERTEWFMKPYWSHTDQLTGAIANYTYEHYAEHRQDLQNSIE